MLERGLYKVVVRFGKEGYKKMLESVSGVLSSEKIFNFLRSFVKERVRDVDEYASGLDVQLGLIAEDLYDAIKDGKVFDKFYVFVYRARGSVGSDVEGGSEFSGLSEKIGLKENPPASLKALAKRAGVSLKRAERYWRETKRDYLERTGKSEDELTDEDYRYIMGVVKKRMGLPTKKVS